MITESINKKYFRFNRGLFTDSMNTRVEVQGLSDIISIVNSNERYKNIHIDTNGLKDTRCLDYDSWGDTTYKVLADFDNYKNQCIGMCNFYEKI